MGIIRSVVAGIAGGLTTYISGFAIWHWQFWAIAVPWLALYIVGLREGR